MAEHAAVEMVAGKSPGRIEPVPHLGVAIDPSLVQGMGKLERHVVMLPDIDQVLTVGEFEAIERAAAPSADEGEGEKDAD